MELTGSLKTSFILLFRKVIGSFIDILELMERLSHALLTVFQNLKTTIIIEYRFDILFT